MLWFESKKDKEARIRKDIIKELKEQKQQEEEQEKAIQAVLDEAQQIHDERIAKEKVDEIADLKESDEPWVVVKGMVEDPKDGVKIELDWNDAFIEYLKKNGITGADEDTIIQKYIALMMQDVAENMVEGQSNEFE